MASTIYSEILILVDILFRYVFGNHFVRHIPAAAAEVSSGPQVPSPKLLLDVLEFRHQVVRRLSFQPLQQPTDRYLRRYRHEQMHMVLRNMPFHYPHLVLRADVPDQISRSRCHLSTQSRSPIFRDPYQVQMNLKNRVRAAPVVRHASSLSCGALAEAVA
jgi:hypothetical protein